MKRDVLLSMNFTIVRNLHNINFTLQAYSIHYNLQSFSVQKLQITRSGSNERGVGLSRQSNISVHF